MVKAKDLREMLNLLKDDTDIFICPPSIEDLQENDGLLEINGIVYDQKNNRWLIETEV